MKEKKKPSDSARSGRDRRTLFDVYYVDGQGAYYQADRRKKKRSGIERRSPGERRVGWRRVSKWGSVPDTIRPLESKTISVSINRDPREVYEFVSNPENLPSWASGLTSSVEKVNGEWFASTPQGQARIRFAERNSYGVLDHYVTLAQGVEVYVPMRVFPNAAGSELVFTLFRLPDMTDEKFEKDAKMVLEDLTALRKLLETNKNVDDETLTIA
jgi:hypothetical protein